VCSVYTFSHGFHSLNSGLILITEYDGSSFQECINFTLHYIADLDIPIKRSVKNPVQ
jgi:hypothetical protein